MSAWLAVLGPILRIVLDALFGSIERRADKAQASETDRRAGAAEAALAGAAVAMEIADEQKAIAADRARDPADLARRLRERADRREAAGRRPDGR